MSNYEKYHDLYLEALSARAEIDARIQRRYEIYYGSKETLNFTANDGTKSKNPVTPFRKMCFELVEAQVDTSIPLAKVTARYAEDTKNASDLEEFLNLEADLINSEEINDIAEREVRIQGTVIYHTNWDESAGSPRRRGDLRLDVIKLGDFYPQPYIERASDLEYVFIHSTTTVRKVKDTYGTDVQPDNGTKNSVDLVICWYLNDKHEVCKLVWTKNTNVVVYDMPNYYARKRKVCAQCGEPWYSGQTKCPVCKGTTTKLLDKDTFTVPEDIYIADSSKPNVPPRLYLSKDTPVSIYRIHTLPFVIRRNISKAGGGLYGVSDVDLLEEAQDANNKIIGKMNENIMQGGTMITLPANLTFENKAGSLKVVRVNDVRQKNLVGSYAIQANTQQDDIQQDRLYQIARQAVGITDAYQGKRDPTAESGKAKEISAMQTAGRLESKYVDKTTAYAEIYHKMFEFLLAFSDEKRKIVNPYSGSTVTETCFNKYSFIITEGQDTPYLNDDYIFSTNGSYVLSNKKEALWQATTQSFMAGSFGNPQDPRTLMIYWNLLYKYGYPLANKVTEFLEANQQRLPPEVEQALLQNPQILQKVMAVMQAEQTIAKERSEKDAASAQAVIAPTQEPVLTPTTDNDLKNEEAAKNAEKEKK